jgi:hypothetical protein
MTLAALIVAAAGALFTALAAGAALWTAKTARDEARERAEPYVAAAAATLSGSADDVEIIVKNLGLGPARLLGLLVDDNGTVIGVHRCTGLAPMEEESITIPLRLQTTAQPVAPERLGLSGQCQDAGGRHHPLFVDGHARTADDADIARCAAFAERFEIRMRHQLKAVVRTVAAGNASASTAAWMQFWLWVEREGFSPAAVDEQAQSFWIDLSGSSVRFVHRSDLILTDEDRRRHDASAAPAAPR